MDYASELKYCEIIALLVDDEKRLRNVRWMLQFDRNSLPCTAAQQELLVRALVLADLAKAEAAASEARIRAQNLGILPIIALPAPEVSSVSSPPESVSETVGSPQTYTADTEITVGAWLINQNFPNRRIMYCFRDQKLSVYNHRSKEYECITLDSPLSSLITLTEAEVLKAPNFGRTSLRDLKQALYRDGLHLGWDATDASRVCADLTRSKYS